MQIWPYLEILEIELCGCNQAKMMSHFFLSLSFFFHFGNKITQQRPPKEERKVYFVIIVAELHHDEEVMEAGMRGN